MFAEGLRRGLNSAISERRGRLFNAGNIRQDQRPIMISLHNVIYTTLIILQVYIDKGLTRIEDKWDINLDYVRFLSHFYLKITPNWLKISQKGAKMRGNSPLFRGSF